jgi:hypothetical protein
MMKRKASATELEYQSPPQCEFKENESPGNHLDFDAFEEQRQQKLLSHDDLYGVEVRVEETPLIVKELLDNLHAELQTFPEKAEIISRLKSCTPSPLENDHLMMRFVRAEQYDVRLATKRVIKHYEKKLELFGSEKLGLNITLDDLEHDDMKTLRSGGFQALPSRDLAGRAVLFERFQSLRYDNPKNLFRTIWFVSMALVEESDPECHLVVVSFQTGPFSPDLFDRAIYKQTINILAKLLPIKLAGFHFCFDDVRFRMVWGLATIYIGKEAKRRAIEHEGAPFECRYGLMSYGINVDDLPITVDGVDDQRNLRKWIMEHEHPQQH